MPFQPRLLLSMIVRNEADRCLRKFLKVHKTFVDAAVIIDDASTDDTVAICKEVLSDIPCKIIINEESIFQNEFVLRKQQWEAAIAEEPQWILNLDADELMEEDFAVGLDGWLIQEEYHAAYFRMYDMWDENHYREDGFWYAHRIYRPFMIRYLPEITYVWNEVPQHCGRFPANIIHLPYFLHSARVRHYGWACPQDRLRKYERYRRLDPDANYGYEAQYASILDDAPNLVAWEEKE